ncbi:MAG: hypothetical protein KGY80_01870 [Candidatus Thorarchaeota archaeon]|nr:hypothetical protein [Candidatus Thorarchaeota archaeon]
MVSEGQPDVNHDIVKMKVLGFFALILTLIVGFMTPYAILRTTLEPPSDPVPPGWTPIIRLYLEAAHFGSGGFWEWYTLDGLDQRSSTLFLVLTLIAALQFIRPARGKRRLLVHLMMLSVFLATWILGVYAIYGQLSQWIVTPIPLTPITAIIARLSIWGASRK